MNQGKQARDLRFAAVCYSIFTALNLFLHILNFYCGFMGIGMDRLLYAVKVMVCVFVIFMASRTGNTRFAPIATAMKITVFCDIAEAFVTEVTAEIKGLALALIIALLLVKILVDYLFYMEFADGKGLRTVWISLNIVLVFFALGSVGYSWFLTVSYVLIIARFVLAVFMICKFNPGEQCDRKSMLCTLSGGKISARPRGIAIGITVAFVIVFLSLRYLMVMPADDYILAGEDTRQYAVCNLLPEWTGFREKRYGIVNTKTGEKTKPIFHHVLNHDESGLAWEETGKFVDLDGNVVFEVPRKTMNAIGKRAVRTKLLSSILDKLLGDDKPQYIDWNGDLLHNDDRTMVRVNGTFFSNGICIFYSEKYGAYGYIDNYGDIIAEPEIVRFSGDLNNEVTLVMLKTTGNTNVINSEGKYLFDKRFDWAETEIDYEMGIVVGKTHFGRDIVKSDFSGNYIE